MVDGSHGIPCAESHVGVGVTTGLLLLQLPIDAGIVCWLLRRNISRGSMWHPWRAGSLCPQQHRSISQLQPRRVLSHRCRGGSVHLGWHPVAWLLLLPLVLRRRCLRLSGSRGLLLLQPEAGTQLLKAQLLA